VHLLFKSIEFVKGTRCGKGQRGTGFSSGPNINEAIEGIFAGLQTHFISNEAGSGAFGTAKSAALVAHDGLDGGEQVRRGHYADDDAGAAENGFDDFAVAVARTPSLIS
jgi:hypothetical protein